MRLYLNDTSPFARLVLVTALELSNTELELVWIDPWASPEPLLRLNPFSMIPTLELHDGTALYESLVICDYLLIQTSHQGAKPGVMKPSDLPSMRRLAMGKTLMEVAFRKVILDRFLAGQHDNLLSERGLIAVKRALLGLDATLCGSVVASSDGVSMSDLCLAVALEYVRFRLPNVFETNIRQEALIWLDGWRYRASFVSTSPDALRTRPGTLSALLRISFAQQ